MLQLGYVRYLSFPPMGPWKVFADGVEVWISGSPMFPALEVAPMSLMPDMTVSSDTANFSCSSVSGFARLLLLYFTFSHLWRALLLLVCGLLRHSPLFLSI